MIDTHAHVYPGISDHVHRLSDNLPGLAKELVQGAALPVAKSALEMITRRLPRIPVTNPLPGLVSIESSARLAEVVPAPWNHRLESVSSLSMAPQVLLLGTLERLLQSMDDNQIERTVV